VHAGITVGFILFEMAQKLIEICCFVRVGAWHAYADWDDYLKKLESRVYSSKVIVLYFNKYCGLSFCPFIFMKSSGIHSAVRSSPLQGSS